MKLKPLYYVALLSTMGALVSCANVETRQERLRKLSANQLIEGGKSETSSGQYKAAIDNFNVLQARFPQGAYAQQAQLQKIYTYYADRKADLALQECDQFIRLYPDHPHVDYVWYMRGVINFDRARSIIDRYLPPDQTQIDSKQLKMSLTDFEVVAQKYPNSQYAEDARQRIIYLNNVLARSELNIANYYQRRNAHVAVINRTQYVLDNYPQTDSVKEALVLQIQAYDALNLTQQKQDRIDILKLNYPNDPQTLLILEGKDPIEKESFFERLF